MPPPLQNHEGLKNQNSESPPRTQRSGTGEPNEKLGWSVFHQVKSSLLNLPIRFRRAKDLIGSVFDKPQSALAKIRSPG
jgi:hypothetical protein